MAEVKFNNNKVISDSNGLTITNDNQDFPARKVVINHDEDCALETIGVGNDLVSELFPSEMVDDGYIDLEADSAGFGNIMVGDDDENLIFTWARDNTVTLVDNSTNVAATDSDTDFCVFDNTSNVRIRNRLGSAKKVLFDIHYTELPIAPTFQAFSVPAGVDNLDEGMAINGTIVSPTFRYKGGDADGTDLDAWTYGETLTAQGSGGTFNTGSPGLGASDDSFDCEGTRHWKADSSSTADLTTEDIVIEAVLYANVGSTQQILNKRDGNDEGYLLQLLSTGSMVVKIEDTSANIVTLTGDVLNSGWYHVMVFLRRSGSGQIYVNGTASGSAAAISSVGTLTNSEYLRVGATSTSSNIPDGTYIAYLALWADSAWLDTHLQADVAAKRFAQVCGYYPQFADGTYIPTTKTRAYEAYLDKIEDGYRKLYYVGDNWLRMCHRQDSLEEDVRGYLSETEAENLITESEDFSTWTLIDAGDLLTDSAVICPDGRTVAASLAPDITNNVHGISTTATLTAATYTLSCFLKPGSRTFAYVYDPTIANCYCYFDIANGTVGTKGVAATGYIEGPFYSGDTTPFYRCCIVFTGTAALHTLRIAPAASDGSYLTPGNRSTPAIYFWGAQCELGDYMTSPIRTSAGSATRPEDQLQFVAGDNIGGEDVGQGTMVADILLPDYDNTVSLLIGSISEGGSGSDRVESYIATTDKASIYSAASGGNVGAKSQDTDVVDNQKHTVSVLYATNSMSVIVDGVQSGSDTLCDVPDDLDTLDVGQNGSSVGQLKGLIQNFRIYAEPLTLG